MNKRIVLIGFYNEKALGVRYLSKALKNAGYEVYCIFFKKYNSARPEKATAKEISLLKDLVLKLDPLFIGMSVMSSMYLETIIAANDALKASAATGKKACPIVWGGVYATLEARTAASFCDYIIRGEGENAIVHMADALLSGSSVYEIPNIAYINTEGEYCENELIPLADINSLKYPEIGSDNIYLIENNRLKTGDPQLKAFTYELTASRGCPFSCSYCSSVNLRRLYRGKGKYVRFRSVDSVIAELKEAKARIPKLRVIHFWDEIFSSEPGWIESFSERYRQEIGLPFRIWGHPLKIDENAISQLCKAGLEQIVVGVQSGSDRIRKEVFHRSETREQIIKMSESLAKCRVPRVYYDFMLYHPFEALSDLKDTYYLCTELAPPFWLNLHGLNFLPATDILQTAVKHGIFNKDELSSVVYGSIEKQYDQYWGTNTTSGQADATKYWSALIKATQFPALKDKTARFAKEAENDVYDKRIFRLVSRAERQRKISLVLYKLLLAAGFKNANKINEAYSGDNIKRIFHWRNRHAKRQPTR